MSNKEIVPENLHLFAYTNFELCKEIKGVVLFLHGLGETSGMTEPNDEARYMAEHGLLYVMPYYGPWSWMNNVAVKIIDRVLDVVFEKYGLDENTPIASTGMSMGGLGALTFPRFSKHVNNITEIVANCPVCDLIRLRETIENIPKSVYFAFCNYDDPEEGAKTVSPIENLDTAVRVPYFIAHCEADTSVPKAEHSDIFVPELLKRGYDVTYVTVPERGHVDLDENALKQYREFIVNHISGR